ncbi:STAS domain-containing protein [Terribacillus sp. JSM ZJ617]|uniref:STAS domain-containing protein n=1 Tax=Terribacillus sp. JSM ZJ617 TaxID=3342119 RepID=UPI0035A9ACED
MKDMIDVNMVVKEKTCNISVAGTLDYTTMDLFNEHLAIIEEKVERVIIDFNGLEFIDSTGIGSIINLVYEAKSKHFGIELKGINEEIQLLFETIGVFQIIESLHREGK